MTLEQVSENFLVQSAIILMGAAYADGLIDGIEDDTILSMMAELVDEGDLPEEVKEAIDDFDPDNFNIEVAAELLLEEPEAHRHHLLQMVAMLRETNEDIEAEDDDFTLRLAELLEIETDFAAYPPSKAYKDPLADEEEEEEEEEA